MSSNDSDIKPRFTLYLLAKSMQSHKVLMTLYEKNEPFVVKNVDPMKRQHLETWYVRLNPTGKDPALLDGGTVITDWKEIVDHIDSELLRLPVLVPNLKTEYGQEVCRWKNLLNIEADILSFGSFYNQEAAPAWIKRYQITTEDVDALLDATVSKLQRLAVQNPDLKEAYLARIPETAVCKTYKDPVVYNNYLHGVQDIFDEVEARLKKTAKECSCEWWLTGSTFTIADISLCVLMRRLSVYEIADKFFSKEKRPCVHRYWERVQTRPSYIKLVKIINKYYAHA